MATNSMDTSICIATSAAWFIMKSLQEKAYPEDAFRITVYEVLRTGPQFRTNFDPHTRPDDVLINLPNGRKVVIDTVSVKLMGGVTIDTKAIRDDPEGRHDIWFRSAQL